MGLGWIIIAVVVLSALFAVTKLLRRLVFGFAIAAGGLLLIHYQTDPVAAGTALAGLGGGLLLAGPLRSVLFRLL